MATRYRDLTPEQKERAKARTRAWRARNKATLSARRRELHLKHYKTRDRDSRYRSRYGISLATYEAMFELQEGRCGICRSEDSGLKGAAFAVDHCHTTLEVRGLLCIQCNTKLGWFERHSDAIAEYLGNT